MSVDRFDGSVEEITGTQVENHEIDRSVSEYEQRSRAGHYYIHFVNPGVGLYCPAWRAGSLTASA